jgi:glycosyltransferase involved in cell wall biosynthesis
MKIAFFYNLFPGGAQRLVYEEVKYLAKHHTVDVFTISDKNEKTGFHPVSFASRKFIYPFSLVSKRAGVPKRIAKDWNNFISLDTLHKQIAYDIDQKKYDIVVVHPDFYTQAPFLLKYLQTKSIYYCHEWLRIAYEKELRFTEDVTIVKNIYEKISREWRKHIDKENAQKATYIVTNSKYTQEHVKKAYKKDTFVCYPGVDTRVFTPQEIEKKYDLFFVGAKDKINGYIFLQKILNTFSTPLTVFYLQDDNNPFLSDRELVKVYNQSKIALCLSYNEPFGIVPLEAMSCQVPVLAVDEGGYKETIDTSKTGYLLPRDVDIFCKKISELLKHTDKAELLGRTGREYVVKKFTWKKHTKEFERLLQSLV